jgi:hypothetical protein
MWQILEFVDELMIHRSFADPATKLQNVRHSYSLESFPWDEDRFD